MMEIPVRMRQTRMQSAPTESLPGFKCQIKSTSDGNAEKQLFRGDNPHLHRTPRRLASPNINSDVEASSDWRGTHRKRGQQKGESLTYDM
ncbi:MAG TPA: hypothetical protein VFO15_12450, partial [Xanthobacteraceae bacterium]|nr:hypothetical protein [Xanthobacteraceae bacterium]